MTNELKYNQYSEMLRYIITEIKSTRVFVAQKINLAMMSMYWNIGKRLSEEKMGDILLVKQKTFMYIKKSYYLCCVNGKVFYIAELLRQSNKCD